MGNNSYSILLVEDNPDHLSFEKRSIERLDGVSHVDSAGSAKEARKKISDNSFDLIVLDYQLPDTDGLSFLESLIEDDRGIPVVMVTGLGSEKIAVSAMKLGAYDYVVKDKEYLKNLPDVIKRSLEKLRLSRSLKIMEAQLRESEERFQKIFENANTGFVSIDLNTGKYINPNKKTLEMTGYSREELESLYYQEIASTEDRDRLKAYHRAMHEGKFGSDESPLDFEFWLLSKNGRKKYVNCTVAMLPVIEEIFITLNDITDRKELEEQLKVAHEKLQQYAKELEIEVDDLKKKLIIEPALENPMDTEQQYNLDFGVSYLIKEKKPLTSYEIFKDFVSHGTFGLCFTRSFPERIKSLYQLEKTPVFWLSKKEGEEGTISGSNLGGLAHAINQFVEKSEKSIVILDGLEYLLTINGFDRTIMYIFDIIENVMVHKSILIIPIHQEALNKKEMAILERQTEVINPGEE